MNVKFQYLCCLCFFIDKIEKEHYNAGYWLGQMIVQP